MDSGASRGRLEPAAGRCQITWSGGPAREKRGEVCGGKDAPGRFLAGGTAPTGGELN
jgi:hypothetical protein